MFRQSVRGHGRRKMPRLECRLCDVDAIYCQRCFSAMCPRCLAGASVCASGKRCGGCQYPVQS